MDEFYIGKCINRSKGVLNEKTITFKIDGIYCNACPAIVKKVLKSIEGVKQTTVSYSTKTAVVTFEDTKTDTTSLIQATTKAGYQARVAN